MTQRETEEEMAKIEAKKIADDLYEAEQRRIKTEGYFWKYENEMGWRDSREKKD